MVESLLVRGLLWRSHLSAWQYAATQNRRLAGAVGAAGGEVLLDQRIRPLGSHHQKFVVVRHPSRPGADVAFLGGIDLAHSRADDAEHSGDRQTRGGFAAAYGDTPPWHDVHIELRGPAVRDVDQVFRERWDDTAVLSRLRWHVLPDRLRGLPRRASPLPAALPDPPKTGTCAVQVLRTAPRRWPRYPFAPRGERSIARAYAKALHRAERLVYIEDQYLWSVDVARLFATALKRSPRLHLIVVVPRYPDQVGPIYLGSARLGQGEALAMVIEAGGERVQVLNVENHAGTPIYVHAKVCIVDDVGHRRQRQLQPAVLDARLGTERRCPGLGARPTDPGGLGDGARRFARQLRLDLMREHLDMSEHLSSRENIDRVDAPDAWYASGYLGPRPPGRLRRHTAKASRPWRRWLTDPAYRALLDPDGRPLGMKLRRTF